MRALSVNLASQPFRNDAFYYASYGICALFLLVMTVYNVLDWMDTSRQLGAVAQSLDPAAEERESLITEIDDLNRRIEQWDARVVNERALHAREFLARRELSWTRLFNHLETVIPKDVMLESVRPSINLEGEVNIRLNGTARNHAALLAFEDALEQSPYFSSVYPGSERIQEGNKWIGFVLSARHDPAVDDVEPDEGA